MSAVMSTLSIISGGRRGHRKLAHTSGRKSGQFSDAGEDRRSSHHDLRHQQRSASMQTLENRGAEVVDLENLEAKMASIEVSLGGAGGKRRDASRELDALRNALSDKDSLIQSLKKQLSASLSAARLAAAAASPAPRTDPPGALTAEERRALEERAASVRTDLDVRKSNIQELRRRLERTHVTDNIDTRIQQAELQYQLGREELELQSLTEQARALRHLTQHAAQRATLHGCVRECGGTATLVAGEAAEGAWGAALRSAGLVLDWADCPALRSGDRLIEVNGVSVLTCRAQDELSRAAGLQSPARLVVLRAPHSPPPAHHSLTQGEAASLRSELSSLRTAADDAERAKEGLRCDNTRLTHRISYLEEQVAELLARHTQLHPVSSNDSSCITVNKTKKNVTSISISSDPPRPSPKSEVQVFQKGPDITALVAKLPGLDGAEASLPVLRPRSNASGASSRPAASPRASPAPHRSQSSHSLEPRSTRMRHSLSHHCISHDYSAETDAAIRMIERNQRHIEKQRLKAERLPRAASDDNFRSDSDFESRPTTDARDRHLEIKKAADRIEESIKKTNWAERKTMSLIEQLKRSQRLRKLKKNESAEDVQLESERHYMYHRIDGKVLENAHKSSRRVSKLHSRSAKSSEIESECSDFPNGELYYSSPRIDYGSETGSTRLSHYKKNEDRRPDGEAKPRPTPPRKPLRLSLHKARSAHSLVNGSESELSSSRPPSEASRQSGDPAAAAKKPVKRTHASEKPGRERTREAERSTPREAGRATPREAGRATPREAGRATPRPARKLLNGLSALEAPAADHLYPDTHAPRAAPAQAAHW